MLICSVVPRVVVGSVQDCPLCLLLQTFSFVFCEYLIQAFHLNNCMAGDDLWSHAHVVDPLSAVWQYSVLHCQCLFDNFLAN